MVLAIAGFMGKDAARRVFRIPPSHDSGGAGPDALRFSEAHIAAGVSAYGSSNFAVAESEFRKAIQLNPNSALAYNDLGAVLNSYGRWDDAIVALQKAAELDPALDLAKNNLVYSISQKARGGRSAATPGNARTAADRLNAGLSLYASSNFAAAEAEFRKAIELDPGSALAYNDLGATLNNLQRWDEAIAALGKAVALNPALDLARNNLAWAVSQKVRGVNGRK